MRQKLLWDLIGNGLIKVAHLSEEEMVRRAHLMEKYQDMPMDLADAFLVALAETRNDPQIFTIDSDFYVLNFTINLPLSLCLNIGSTFYFCKPLHVEIRPLLVLERSIQVL